MNGRTKQPEEAWKQKGGSQVVRGRGVGDGCLEMSVTESTIVTTIHCPDIGYCPSYLGFP